MHRVKIEAFEGPLSLLLKLIEDQKLDITQVSLARVTDQYLEYLNQLSNLDPDELADFLVIATKLLFIKSKTLLPSLPLEEEEFDDLEEQLKIYKEFLEASVGLQKIIAKKRFLFFRPRISGSTVVFSPPQKTDQKILRDVFQKILREILPMVNLPEEKIKKIITLEEKISQIQNLIFNQLSVSFKDIITCAESKTEIIVSFLALLELVKQRQIVIYQENIFEEIVIKKI